MYYIVFSSMPQCAASVDSLENLRERFEIMQKGDWKLVPRADGDLEIRIVSYDDVGLETLYICMKDRTMLEAQRASAIARAFEGLESQFELFF